MPAPEPEAAVMEEPPAEAESMTPEEAPSEEEIAEAPAAEGEPPMDEAAPAEDGEAMESMPAEPEPEPEPMPVEPEPEPEPVVAAPPPPAVTLPPVTEGTVPEFGYLEYADEVPEPAERPDELAMLVPESQGPGGGRPVRVAVLHSADEESSGMGVAIVIDLFRAPALKRDIGMPVQVVYISRIPADGPRVNVVRYREGALKAAMQVARHLPMSQTVEPMTKEEAAKRGVDLIVYLGAGLH